MSDAFLILLSANCNVHFHMTALDGVYAPKTNGEPEFFPLRPPETSDVQKIVDVVAQRASAMLKRRAAENIKLDRH